MLETGEIKLQNLLRGFDSRRRLSENPSQHSVSGESPVHSEPGFSSAWAIRGKWIPLDEHWQTIEQLAAARNNLKRGYPSNTEYTAPDQANLIGFAGEFVFAVATGTVVDSRLHPHGDGGKDFSFNGGSLDVKTSTFHNGDLLHFVDAKHTADYFALVHLDVDRKRGRLVGIVPSSTLRRYPTRDYARSGRSSFAMPAAHVVRASAALFSLVAA